MKPEELAIIRGVLPETWTHVSNLNWLKIGFHLKLAGIDWRSLEDGMAQIERLGLVQRDGWSIRRAPGSRP